MIKQIPRNAREIQFNSRQKDVYKSQITIENIVSREIEVIQKTKG